MIRRSLFSQLTEKNEKFLILKRQNSKLFHCELQINKSFVTCLTWVYFGVFSVGHHRRRQLQLRLEILKFTFIKILKLVSLARKLFECQRSWCESFSPTIPASYVSVTLWKGIFFFHFISPSLSSNIMCINVYWKYLLRFTQIIFRCCYVPWVFSFFYGCFDGGRRMLLVLFFVRFFFTSVTPSAWWKIVLM